MKKIVVAAVIAIWCVPSATLARMSAFDPKRISAETELNSHRDDPGANRSEMGLLDRCQAVTPSVMRS
jgi:hypothetical protein